MVKNIFTLEYAYNEPVECPEGFSNETFHLELPYDGIKV